MTEGSHAEKNKHSFSINFQNINRFPMSEWQVNKPLPDPARNTGVEVNQIIDI